MDNNAKQIILIISACVGGSLIYLAYDLLKALPDKTGGEIWFLILPSITFVLIGIALVIISIKKFMDNLK